MRNLLRLLVILGFTLGIIRSSHLDEPKSDSGQLRPNWLKPRWTSWATILISSAALFISIRSCSIADDANIIAEKARNDMRAIERLDLEPTISFKLEPRTINDYPPHLTIANYGPVDAQQVNIQLLSLRYEQSKPKIRIKVFGSERWTIQKLEVMQTENIEIPLDWLETNAQLDRPLKNNVIEACITYRRDPDRKFFGKRAFYFMNPDNKWVSENNTSIDNDEYVPIINAAHNSTPCGQILEMPFYKSRDALHDFDLFSVDSTGE